MDQKGLTYLIGGVIAAFAGANMAAWGKPGLAKDPHLLFLIAGCAMVVVGSTLVRMARRRLHHTITDPVGIGLIIVGIAVFGLVRFLADPVWSIFGVTNLAVAIFLGGTMLIRNRKKGV